MPWNRSLMSLNIGLKNCEVKFLVSRKLNMIHEQTNWVYSLMSSPLKPVLVTAAYLYFVYNLGPKLMENRKAFKLKAVLVLYNLIQIILNSYITIE
ncbi:hypothetical protein NQ318_005895 [Aromia moschata]|uniref:Elongation of very long chain fatty acids protein n=1 Tax=Aromia moschata TaxID=1265417 RepID=A0AAV8YUI5_9CUCU|nr:hypothetical protein NQ318_005895 [Aromia moschata]